MENPTQLANLTRDFFIAGSEHFVNSTALLGYVDQTTEIISFEIISFLLQNSQIVDILIDFQRILIKSLRLFRQMFCELESSLKSF